MSKSPKLLKSKVVKKISTLSQIELVELVLKLGNAINNIDDSSKNHFRCGCCGEPNWSHSTPRHTSDCEIVKARSVMENM